MIDDENLDIIDLLQHAGITDELYASLISYAPSQHHSAYSWEYFAPSFLTAIQNMVGVILFTHLYIRGLSVAVSLYRTLVMAGKPTVFC